MDERQADVRVRSEADRTMKRRGILAGAAALVAGLVGKLAMDPQPVEAATGNPLLLGSVNAATGTDVTVTQNRFKRTLAVARSDAEDDPIAPPETLH